MSQYSDWQEDILDLAGAIRFLGGASSDTYEGAHLAEAVAYLEMADVQLFYAEKARLEGR